MDYRAFDVLIKARKHLNRTDRSDDVLEKYFFVINNSNGKINKY